MLRVRDIITRVRAMAHDEQEIGYSDQTLLYYINDGLRFARRIIMDTYPPLLVDMELEGTLGEGENTIYADRPISAIVDVRINGERIGIVNPRSITNLAETGMPYQHYMTGFDKIKVWPVPNKDVDYLVLAVGDMEALDIDGTDPMPAEFEDFVYEYVVMRASVGNEFNMSQEQTIMTSTIQQIQTACRSFMPPGIKTRSYWSERKNS